MGNSTPYTMNKSDLITRIAGLPDADPRIPAMAATLLGGPQQSQPVSGRLFNLGNAAKEMDVSRPTLWRMIRDKEIRTVELRKGIKRIPESELRRIAEGRP